MRGPFEAACEVLFDRTRLDRYGILSSAELSRGGFRKWVAGTDACIAWHAFALAAWCEAELGDGGDALREILSRTQPAGASSAGRAPAAHTTGSAVAQSLP